MSEEPRALYFRKGPIGGEIERPFWVTGKSDRQIERIEIGMLMNKAMAGMFVTPIMKMRKKRSECSPF